MKEFKTLEDLKNDKTLQNLCKTEWEKVKVNGKEVIACGTNLAYEDTIWGGAYDIISEINKEFRLNLDTCEMASVIRDKILELMFLDYGIEFVDMYEEY